MDIQERREASRRLGGAMWRRMQEYPTEEDIKREGRRREIIACARGLPVEERENYLVSLSEQDRGLMGDGDYLKIYEDSRGYRAVLAA